MHEHFLTKCRWSFGGNRLQIKAETHLLADVEVALQNTSYIGAISTASMKSIQLKQELLMLLIDNEQTRLMVWLFPLDHSERRYFASSHSAKGPSDVGGLILSCGVLSDTYRLPYRPFSRLHGPKTQPWRFSWSHVSNRRSSQTMFAGYWSTFQKRLWGKQMHFRYCLAPRCRKMYPSSSKYT